MCAVGLREEGHEGGAMGAGRAVLFSLQGYAVSDPVWALPEVDRSTD